MIVQPAATMVTLCKLLGSVLILIAVFLAVVIIRSRNSQIMVLGTVPTLICLGAGIWIFTVPRLILSFIPIMIGVIVLLLGIQGLAHQIQLRRLQRGYHPANMMATVIMIVLGAILVFFPWSTVKAVVIIVGVVMVYQGGSSLHYYWKIKNQPIGSKDRLNDFKEDPDIIDVEYEEEDSKPLE